MKKLLISITIPLLCLFIGGAFLLFTKGAFLPSARAIDTDKIQLSIVRIVTVKSEDGEGADYTEIGAGFIINENGNIVTSQRVVDGASQIFALRSVGGVTRLFRCKCDASQRSEELNLAVLTSSIKGKPLVMNTAEPKRISKVYAVGYPAISDPTDTDGKNAFLAAILSKRDDPAVDGAGAEISREMSENKLQDLLIPSFSTGRVKRVAIQALLKGSGTVSWVECDIPTMHGTSGGLLLDEGGCLIGVGASGAHAYSNDTVDALAEGELEKFLVKCKISFQRSTSGKR
jgi:S1-C subfamily serine protease